ncbi:hypothetical protein, partial [Vibrio sp. 2-2(9)]|uniref:hypothetical protein n=1 Tax=Vibrio sp. 2-2(9) TaxID=2591015 RepID=UPI001BB2BCF2
AKRLPSIYDLITLQKVELNGIKKESTIVLSFRFYILEQVMKARRYFSFTRLFFDSLLRVHLGELIADRF